MVLLDGKAISSQIKAELAEETAQRRAQGLKVPHLAAILVGNDGPSETYVNSKVKTCQEIGFESTLLRFDHRISEAALLAEIQKVNENPFIDGLIVQVPLPAHISVDKVMETISPAKDVDGFHPINVGKTVKNLPTFLPATPYGILMLLKRYEIETQGRHCVIIGRSQIVGTPMSILMARNEYPGNATVTLTHSKTRDLEGICRQADILIAAIGRPGMVGPEMVKQGAVVIDVGINRIEDCSKKSGFRLVGDVDFDRVAPLCSYITPVPGGVGLMTIAGLMRNTLKAARKDFYP
jgi:methylenetetrahydrofolate dehydrogenase (NADP+) / methenyltetrahydrofolate cyclohydrolase